MWNFKPHTLPNSTSKDSNYHYIKSDQHFSLCITTFQVIWAIMQQCSFFQESPFISISTLNWKSRNRYLAYIIPHVALSQQWFQNSSSIIICSLKHHQVFQYTLAKFCHTKIEQKYWLASFGEIHFSLCRKFKSLRETEWSSLCPWIWEESVSPEFRYNSAQLAAVQSQSEAFTFNLTQRKSNLFRKSDVW